MLFSGSSPEIVPIRNSLAAPKRMTQLLCNCVTSYMGDFVRRFRRCSSRMGYISVAISLTGKVHLFLVQNKPSGRRVTFGWYLLSPTSSSSSSSSSATSSGSEEWIPQRWALPALRNYFMHTLESNCVAVTLPSHVLRDGAFLCDKRKHGLAAHFTTRYEI